jgi:hypothetical protein
MTLIPRLEKLAALGNNGLHPHNMRRDLSRVLGETLLPTPAVISLPLSVNSITGWSMEQQCVLWPHEMFAAIYHNIYDVFMETCLGGHESNPSAFWKNVKNHPALIENPRSCNPAFPRKAIPICAAGDGVPVTAIGKLAKIC